MGTGNSRECCEQRHDNPFRKKRRGGFFRRLLDTTTLPIVYASTQPITYHRSSFAERPPIYGPIQPQFLPMPYINPAPSFIPSPPQPMMMSPSPYMIPPSLPPPPAPMQMSYPQPAPMQPAYNNMQVPVTIPGGTGPYASPYSSIPPRLATDWTRGGVISPGFLGPPI